MSKLDKLVSDATVAKLTKMQNTLEEIAAEYKKLATDGVKANKKLEDSETALVKSNKKLLDNKKKLNTTTKKATKTTEKYSKAMKTASSNASGMSKAISVMPSGLKAAASGMMSLVKASLAFIATPLGLVIAAIAAAFMAVKTALTSTVEGQKKLNRIMNFGKAIFEVFKTIVVSLGEVLIDIFTNPKETITELWKTFKTSLIDKFTAFIDFFNDFGGILKDGFNLIGLEIKKAFGKDVQDDIDATKTNIANLTVDMGKQIKIASGLQDVADGYTAVADAIQDNIDRSQELSDLQDEMYDRGLKDPITIAKNEQKIAKLRADAALTEGQAKIDLLNQANKLEEDNLKLKMEEKQRLIDEQILKMKRGVNDKEAEQTLVDLKVDLINVQTQYFNLVHRNNASIFTEERKIETAKKKAKEEQIKLNKQILKDSEDDVDAVINEIDKELDATLKAGKQVLNAELKNAEILAAKKEAIAKHQAELEREINEMSINSMFAGIQFLGDAMNAYYNRKGELSYKDAKAQYKLNQSLAFTSASLQFAIALIAAQKSETLAGVILRTILATLAYGSAIARIASTPPPKRPAHAKGKDYTSNEFVAGEKGRELVFTDDGNAYLATTPTLFTNSLGSTVLNNSDTEAALSGNNISLEANISLDKRGIIVINKKYMDDAEYVNKTFKN